MQHKNTFWMVWGPNGNPRHRHREEMQANREADRLAIANPNCEFIVMQATYSAISLPLLKTNYTDQVPF